MFIRKTIIPIKNKNRAFYQKMVKIKIVDFLEMNNFTF